MSPDGNRKDQHLHQWEIVNKTHDDEYTKRMTVPGGWLYFHQFPSDGGRGCQGAMAFVPNPARD